jgi:valyl-tRNA synthetase
VSIHRAAWPAADTRFDDATALAAGDALLDIATAVRRYKSDNGLALGAELTALRLSGAPPELAAALREATADLLSITRARAITFDAAPNGHGLPAGRMVVYVEP